MSDIISSFNSDGWQNVLSIVAILVSLYVFARQNSFKSIQYKPICRLKVTSIDYGRGFTIRMENVGTGIMVIDNIEYGLFDKGRSPSADVKSNLISSLSLKDYAEIEKELKEQYTKSLDYESFNEDYSTIKPTEVRRQVEEHLEGEHPEGEHPEGEHPEGVHPEGVHPEGEHPEGEHPEGELPEGVHPEGEHPDGEHPEGEHPKGEHPEGEQPEGGQPKGEHPEGEQPEGVPKLLGSYNYLSDIFYYFQCKTKAEAKIIGDHISPASNHHLLSITFTNPKDLMCAWELASRIKVTVYYHSLHDTHSFLGSGVFTDKYYKCESNFLVDYYSFLAAMRQENGRELDAFKNPDKDKYK